MDKYIEIDAAYKTLTEYYHHTTEYQHLALRGALSRAPAADVVPVVRCGECEYRKDARVNEKGFLICPASGMEITDNDFCSYGARMDGEENG